MKKIILAAFVIVISILTITSAVVLAADQPTYESMNVTLETPEVQTTVPEFIVIEYVEPMPELVQETPKADTVASVYAQVFESMTAEDIDYWAKSLYLEAGDSNYDCRRATAEVYCNRVIGDPWWGETIKEVINKPGQFVTTKNIKNVVEGQPYKPYGDPCVDLQPYRDVINDIKKTGCCMIDTYVKKNGLSTNPLNYVYFGTGKFNGRNYIFVGQKGCGHYISTQ